MTDEIKITNKEHFAEFMANHNTYKLDWKIRFDHTASDFVNGDLMIESIINGNKIWAYLKADFKVVVLYINNIYITESDDVLNLLVNSDLNLIKERDEDIKKLNGENAMLKFKNMSMENRCRDLSPIKDELRGMIMELAGGNR